jgi:predicted DNA-binding protein with PD1-like motif
MDTLQHLVERRRAFLVVFRTGDEAAAGLLDFARRHDVEAARLSGVGGFSRVKLGYFDCEKKAYVPIDVSEQVEVVSLIGNLTMYDGAPRLHAHVMVTRSDGTARGGHLLQGRVRPTLEITVEELPIRVSRSLDAASGLPLIDVGASRATTTPRRS